MATIAAISTAVGESGIGIVRISGSQAIEVGNKIFRGVKDNQLKDGSSRRLSYGHIIDGDKLVDEVLMVYMNEPYTYTRENMVEIYCHGGIISVKSVLDLILRSGARLAEPGEFTKRAFLNGRLDLSQAEAVMDVIRAKTDQSFKVSLNQLEGNLSREINEIKDHLLQVIAHLEASIDFTEEDLDEISYDDLKEQGGQIRERIAQLLATADRGKILRDGLNTVILGKPNVGKSSLLNAILRENRAIVTDVPGTTRDIIEEYVNIDGIPLKIIDTAGIRSTEDIVEKIGVDMAKKTLDDADLIIAVFDGSADLTDEDFQIIDLIRDRKSLVILNKTDLPSKLDKSQLEKLLDKDDLIISSMVENIGVDELEESIKTMFYDGQLDIESDNVITNIRHKNLLEQALNSIDSALVDIDIEIPMDCIEVDLRNAWENLGEIAGQAMGEDVIDRIFSDFCLGK